MHSNRQEQGHGDSHTQTLSTAGGSGTLSRHPHNKWQSGSRLESKLCQIVLFQWKTTDVKVMKLPEQQQSGFKAVNNQSSSICFTAWIPLNGIINEIKARSVKRVLKIWKRIFFYELGQRHLNRVVLCPTFCPLPLEADGESNPYTHSTPTVLGLRRCQHVKPEELQRLRFNCRLQTKEKKTKKKTLNYVSLRSHCESCKILAVCSRQKTGLRATAEKALRL